MVLSNCNFMRKLKVIGAFVVLGISICVHAYPQQSKEDSTLRKTDVSEKSLNRISQKSDHYFHAINSRSVAVLNKMEKLENKYYRKIARMDSGKAKEIFQNSKEFYDRARTVLQNKLDLTKRKAIVYVPWLDSVGTTLKYLGKRNLNYDPESFPEMKEIDKTLESIKGLQEMLGKSKSITKLIDERKNMLLRQFQETGLLKDLKKLQTTVYYYKAQLAEYKDLLNEPDQLFSKSIRLLQKIPAFNEFYSRNSVLSQYFRPSSSNPQDPAYLQSLTGLQTRESVSKIMQQKLGTEKVPDAQQQLDQLVQSNQSEIDRLKSKIVSGISQLSKEAEQIPNFKPQSNKTKTFFKRLEYGVNIQTKRATSFYPISTDIGISIGYKINDKSIVGIGGSYSFGWGKDLKHIQITHKGAGIRTFVDWNMKWGLWLTGGYEMNYNQVFRELSQLKSFDAWQQSGLIGLSKNIPINSKYLKFSKVQVLLDLLSFKEIPQTQALLVRVGYGF